MTKDKFSKHQKPSAPTTEASSVSADQVAAYLAAHTEFFNEYPNLLSRLSLSYADGRVISLFEKQVVVLREQNAQIHDQLKELIDIAHENEALAKKIHRLNLALISTRDPTALFGVLYQGLTESFHADCVSVRIFAKPAVALRGVEFVGTDPETVNIFETLLKNGEVFCGELEAPQRAFLFGDRFPKKCNDIASSVIVPLSDQNWQGIIAIGSFEHDRFKAYMSGELLLSMADVLTVMLTPWVDGVS